MTLASRLHRLGQVERDLQLRHRQELDEPARPVLSNLRFARPEEAEAMRAAIEAGERAELERLAQGVEERARARETFDEHVWRHGWPGRGPVTPRIIDAYLEEIHGGPRLVLVQEVRNGQVIDDWHEIRVPRAIAGDDVEEHEIGEDGCVAHPVRIKRVDDGAPS